MAVLELVSSRPDWMGALTVALTRPAGVPERRAGDDPWAAAGRAQRPRRISDDLAWLRQAFDEPADHGIKGQVRCVSRMVEDDRYCIDVLTQISAIQAALDKVALGLLDGHTRHCMIGGASEAASADELMAAVGRL